MKFLAVLAVVIAAASATAPVDTIDSIDEPIIAIGPWGPGGLKPEPVITPPQPQEEIPAPTSPLVQIIINVQAQKPTPVVPPTPVIEPTPIETVDSIDEPIIAIGPWGPGGLQPEPAVIDSIDEPIIAIGPWGPGQIKPEPAVIDSIDEPNIAVGPWSAN